MNKMRKKIYLWLFVFMSGIAMFGCSEEVQFSPAVPYRIELNDSVFHIGDSLHGRIVVIEDSLVSGMKVKKIDCRLGNIVIGSVKNAMICPFGVRLLDKPIGTHTFSVIIKCEAPGCDDTFWRYDYKMITIKQKQQ